MNSYAGQLLIADPRLADPNFFRSVVLITQHGGEGASGVILNQPVNVWLNEIWSELSESPLGTDRQLFRGGPVQGPLSVLHDWKETSELTVIPGLYLSMSRDHLDRLLARESGECRVITGYSGWGAGQLESEIEAGGWLLARARPNLVFADPESVYRTVCEEIGRDILFAGHEPVSIPANPSLN
jgi:putative transcriptional regulator